MQPPRYRSGRWKLFLTPALQLYDLESDPGETAPVRDAETNRKLRGMAVAFQNEMNRDARPAGDISGAQIEPAGS